MTDQALEPSPWILRLGNAFCESQALLTAAELDLFTVLRAGPATERELCERLGLSGRGVRDFLYLLVRLGLLTESGGRYRNSPDAARHLVAGEPGYLGGFLRGAKANLYPVWGGLTETLRTGRPRSAADSFAAMLDDPAEVRRYARMMDGVLRPLLKPLLDAVDWAAYPEVLDVGGCRGSLVAELVVRHSGMSGHVFDLPQLEPVFAEQMAEAGVAERVTFHAGDFFTDPLPPADLIVFGHVLHNWDARQRELLVRAAFDALRPGGALLVHDRMLDPADPRVDNLLASLTMALVTEAGGEYPVEELAELARAAGFAEVRRQPLDANETLVLCDRAA
ncbi:methyltransferase [Micromonospora sp. RTGN7]|uniref:methyltransferase n=1 Tax=Micromonospora sp. RTGN7 TaxID=3016526 RepID=UPI0029FED3B8|nr:methyltransferase [Micromonospora sp. RTGN7]